MAGIEHFALETSRTAQNTMMILDIIRVFYEGRNHKNATISKVEERDTWPLLNNIPKYGSDGVDLIRVQFHLSFHIF